MKYSVAAVSALVAVALAKPEFLNSKFEVQEGQPFTLEYSGCSDGCTITLQTGKSTDLKDVKVLTTSATGSSTTVTLEDLPSGTYNFKITDKEGQSNFSQQFPFQGTGVASSSAATSATSAAESNTAAPTTTEAATSTTEAASTTSEESTTVVKTKTAHSTTTEASSTFTTTTTVAHSTHKHNTTTVAPTGSASTTTGHHTTAASTSSNPAVTTVPPGSAAGHLSSPLALVAGVAIAIAFFS
ncbi:hypothetical protein MKX07_005356 [Trichoderma sp. CBMAI-0711]|uniref:Predicted protein n=2 Tax=Hypocrea jecorina TaxID=51453 RepID=G0R6Q5_HYPJQ|nr:uncharacterized protein TRIREDRAFT_119568 [Trichoderma reesei QM6a]EGR52678.1 predicted protein [Trichoderma reesei QM6a]ETS06264.1 hypothetical protein M419DRAFT_31607 [Trichoderma reesei RUT C-30]KAK1250801.1 hypothetical protein MKX07_005356 [Trichoderma sp. CBMAI-0711]